MAEAEQNDKNAPIPHRRPYHPHQNRSGSSYRGRGRANASVSKALHLFGVRDLREILDRKHQDDEQTENGPPPDPSYNYLKDPSRESANEHQTQRHHKEEHPERISGDTHPRGHNFRGTRGRGRGGGIPRDHRHYESEKEGRGGGPPRDHRHYESQKASFLQNPVNIKIEVLASTGERNCKLDEDTKIPDIKHIPNYKLKDLRPKSEGAAGKTFTDRYRNDGVRGRGRGQRGRRGRGSGERGRGRGQGRYSNRNNENDKNNQSQQQTTNETTSEENWDDNTPVKNEEVNENEEEYTQDQDIEDDGPEQYYEGEEEPSQVHEQNPSLEGVAGEDEVKLEDNLVITSSENDEKHKRTVKFKLDDAQSEQGSKGDEKESSEKKGDEKGDAAGSGE